MSESWHDPEGPSEADLARFGSDTRACPNCGSDVYDEATVCQTCGEIISETKSASKGWVVWVAIIALIAFILVIAL
ncbi:MAG: hypothetical protein AAGK04_12380 [Planctomycetota bacterium]